MRLLLDTHIALWALTDDPRLTQRARELLANPGNSVFVSAVSVWEIAIKHERYGREIMPISGEEARDAFQAAGYEPLAISMGHAAAVDGLPPIHRDPFDRLLVAQALTEPLRLVTSDRTVARYSDTVILA